MVINGLGFVSRVLYLTPEFFSGQGSPCLDSGVPHTGRLKRRHPAGSIVKVA